MYEPTDAYRRYMHKVQKSMSNLPVDMKKLLDGAENDGQNNEDDGNAVP